MPSKPKRPCAYPGCPKLTDGQYCEEHKVIARRNYNKYERTQKYDRAWKRIRDRYIHAHPLCEDCLERQRYVPAAEVHHVIPLSQGGLSDVSNLRALCRSCHQKRHIAIGDRKPFR